MVSPESPIPVPRDTGTRLHLSPGQRAILRTAWVIIVALTLWLYAAGLPYQYRALINGPQADPGLLADANLTPEFFAAYDLTLDILTSAIFVGVALFLFWRRPDDPMALFSSLMLVTFGTAVVTLVIDSAAQNIPAAVLPKQLIEGVGNASLVAFLYTFPDGRFVPRWTRWLVGGYALWFILSEVFPAAPFSSNHPDWPEALKFAVPFAAYVGAMPIQEWRKRHHLSKAQRQQAKWIHMGLGVALVGFVGLFALEGLPDLIPSLSLPILEMFKQGFLFITLPGIPLGIAFAVLRYRLWDIDFVLNRSLIYGTLTAVLGLIFLGCVLGLQYLFRSLTGGQQAPIALAASTLVIGALFQPARRALRRLVDQRIFGIYVNYHQRGFSLRSASPQAGLSGMELGKYRIEAHLGRGGMADVYKGSDTTLGRPVAIKTLPANYAGEADFVRRFEREAQTIAALRHPNIVTLYDYGQQNGTYYMVMEYISGRDLSEVIREAAPLPVDQARVLIGDIAAALDYAHAQGVVHRDVKPSNVMLQRGSSPGAGRAGLSERAILTDFGIARMIGGENRLTQTGIIGTFDYISPEQIHGAEIDGRADVYALAVMAFQMLTGRLPFEATHPGAVLIAHLQQPAPDPRTVRADLPAAASASILRALEKEPAHRFETAGAFAVALG